MSDRRRIVLGAVIGVAIIVVAVRLRAEAHSTAGVLETLRRSDRDLLALAAAFEACSYLIPGVALMRICPGLAYPTAVRVAVAALGIGSLLPAGPIAGSGLGYAELRRLAVPRGRAASAATALVIGIPALSMLVLAGPTLVASGLAAPLQPGWRGVVLAAGGTAVVATLLLAALLAGASISRRGSAAVAVFGGPRDVCILLALGAGAWLCDIACLWLAGRALGIDLPLSCLPIAYVVGMVIMALPVLPSGLGAVEVTVPAVFAVGGIAYGDALLAVLAWRVLSFWLPTAFGGLALASLHRGRPVVAPLET